MNQFISIISCVVIIVIGFMVFFKLADIRKKLTEVYRSFDRIKTSRKDDYQEYLEENGNPVIVSARNYVIYDRDKLENNRELFNTVYAEYVAWTQLITLFPMLGILGTVMGLIFGGSLNNIDQLVSGLGMALWTTLLGLLFAIGLKAYDSISLGRLINNIDAAFNKADSVISKEQLRFDIEHAIHKHAGGLQDPRKEQAGQTEEPEQTKKQLPGPDPDRKSAPAESKEADGTEKNREKALDWPELSDDDF